MTVLGHEDRGLLDHEAFIYGSDDDYVGVLAPLVEQAVAGGHVAIAVVPDRNAGLLRSALGASADAVEFIDATGWYRQPAGTLARYDAVLRGLRARRRAWVIGEVQFGSRDVDWAGWTRYEAAVNRVLEHHDARVVCPYDRRSLPDTVIADARRTHPYLLGVAARSASADYAEPESLIPQLPSAVDVPGDAPDVELRVDGTVRAARHAFADVAAAAGFTQERIHELTVAVNEVLTNAVVHGGGTATLRLWTDPDELTCVIADRGPGTDDAVVGLRPPQRGATGGYGFWAARLLFERSDVVASPGGGLTVVLAASPGSRAPDGLHSPSR